MSESTQLALHPFSFIWPNEDEMAASESRLEKLLQSLSRSFGATSDVLGSAVSHIPAAAGVVESLVGKVIGFTTGVASKLESDYQTSRQKGVSLEVYRANEYAAEQSAGQPEQNQAFVQEYHGLTKSLNFDNTAAAENAGRYMTSLRKAETVVEILREKAGAGLAAELTGPIDKLTETLVVSFGKIEPTFKRIISVAGDVASVVGNAFSGLISGVAEIIGWWQQLDSSTQTVITTIAGLTAVWFALNSAFLASPIGMVLALAGAIGLLYDDYMKWQQDGESLIDWGAWEPVLKAATDMISGLTETIKNLAVGLADMFGIDLSKWSLSGIFEGLIGGFNQLGETLQKVGKLINALKEGDWSQVAAIGKDLIVGGFSNSLPGMLAEKAGDLKNWLMDDEKPAAQGAKSTVMLSSKAINNLAAPDAGAMLMPGTAGDNGRFATSRDITQNSSSSVVSPTITNKTDIVINGATDPVAVGSEVERRQTNVYSNLAQMYTPGVS